MKYDHLVISGGMALAVAPAISKRPHQIPEFFAHHWLRATVPPAREGVDDVAAVGSGRMITTVNVISVPPNHQKNALTATIVPMMKPVLWDEHRQKLAAEHAPMIEHQSPLQIENDGEMMVDTTVDVTQEPAPAGDGGVLKFLLRPRAVAEAPTPNQRHQAQSLRRALRPVHSCLSSPTTGRRRWKIHHRDGASPCKLA